MIFLNSLLSKLEWEQIMRVMTDKEIELLDSRGVIPALQAPGHNRKTVVSVAQASPSAAYGHAPNAPKSRRGRRLSALGRGGALPA